METRLLRRVIHYIWECYRQKSEIRIRLKNHNGDELHVDEDLDNWLVAVRYFAKQPAGELVKDFEAVCFIMIHGEWVPLQLFQVGSANMIYGRAQADDGKVEILDYRGQAKAAGLCDAWAFKLLEHGFLAQAAKLTPVVRNPNKRPKWPQPTVPAPSLEQIEDWIWEDGGCEATDGCWLEPDGICPHGHPSWLLKLGLT